MWRDVPRGARVAVWMLLWLTVAGCQTTDPPPVVIAPDPQPDVVITTPAPDPAPPPEVVEPAPPQPVGVLVSSEAAVFADIGQALMSELQPVLAFNLAEQSLDTALAAWRDGGVTTVVAIGEVAAIALSPHADVFELLYTQVFKPLRDDQRGVPALPSALPQLSAWREQHAQLSRVGIITSGQFAPLAHELQRAGLSLDIEVKHALVSSDKEAMFEFRRMAPQLDGYVFVPDEAILSPLVIQRVMAHAEKNDIQILTYNNVIYRLGATLQVTQNPEEVVQAVVELLSDPALVHRPLAKIRVRRNGSEEYVDFDA